MDEIVRRLRSRSPSSLRALKESLPVKGINEDEEEEETTPEDEVDPAVVDDIPPEEDHDNTDADDAPPAEDEGEGETEISPDDIESESTNPLDNAYAVKYELGQKVVLTYSNGKKSNLVGTIEGYDKEGFYRIKWSNNKITSGITDLALSDIVEAKADISESRCVCGSHEYIVENDQKICDKCGREFRALTERMKLSRDQINQIVAEKMEIDISEAKKLVSLVDWYGYSCFDNIYDLLVYGEGEWAPTSVGESTLAESQETEMYQFMLPYSDEDDLDYQKKVARQLGLNFTFVEDRSKYGDKSYMVFKGSKEALTKYCDTYGQDAHDIERVKESYGIWSDDMYDRTNRHANTFRDAVKKAMDAAMDAGGYTFSVVTADGKELFTARASWLRGKCTLETSVGDMALTSEESKSRAVSDETVDKIMSHGLESVKESKAYKIRYATDGDSLSDYEYHAIVVADSSEEAIKKAKIEIPEGRLFRVEGSYDSVSDYKSKYPHSNYKIIGESTDMPAVDNKYKKKIRAEQHPVSTAVKPTIEESIRNIFKKNIQESSIMYKGYEIYSPTEEGDYEVYIRKDGVDLVDDKGTKLMFNWNSDAKKYIDTLNESDDEGDSSAFQELRDKLENEFWTRLPEMIDDIEALGYEVIDYNHEYVTIAWKDDEGDEGELLIYIGGTSRTLTLDFNRTRFYAEME